MTFVLIAGLSFLMGVLFGALLQAHRNKKALVDYLHSTAGKQLSTTQVIDDLFKLVVDTNIK